ncbi:MAG: hypothetical protein ABH863_02215, partial [Candidatus Micrarchaeota archaeon]
MSKAILFLLLSAILLFVLPQAHAADEAPIKLDIGLIDSSYVFELRSISIPESAKVTFEASGTSCKADAEGYCSFDFGKATELVFEGVNGLKAFNPLVSLGIKSRGLERLQGSFQVRKIYIRKEFFNYELFTLTGEKLRFNPIRLEDKDAKEFECYGEPGKVKYCELPFDDGDLKKAAPLGLSYKESEWKAFRKVYVEVSEIAKREVVPENRLQIYYLEKGDSPISKSIIKINGVSLEKFEGKIGPIETLEYDFGGQIVPLRVLGKRTRALKENIFITGLLIENAGTLSNPTQGEIARKIYDVTGDGTISNAPEKVRKELLKYLADGLDVNSKSTANFIALVPKSENLEFGFRPKSVDLTFGEAVSGGAQPESKAAVEIEKTVGGKATVKLDVTATRQYFPKMLEYAQTIREMGSVQINLEGLQKLEWPSELDTEMETETVKVGESKEYIYAGEDISETVDLTKDIGELEDGQYIVKAALSSEVYEEEKLVISHKDGITQFTLSTSDAALVYQGSKPAMKIALKDKGSTSALVQIDDEKCLLGAEPCTLSISPDNKNGWPFYRLIGNKFLLFVMQSPENKDEVVFTVVPLSKVEVSKEVSVTATTGDLIKNLRARPAYDGAPALRKLPFYAKDLKERETMSFTPELEMLIFNVEFDRDNSDYVFEVRHFSGVLADNTGELVHRTSYRGRNLKGIASEATGKVQTGTYLATETWRGYYLGTGDGERAPVKAPAGLYVLTVKICTKTTKLCETVRQQDQVVVKVNPYDVKTVESSKKLGEIKVLVKGNTGPVEVYGFQGDKATVAKDPESSEYNYDQMVMADAAPELLQVNEQGVTIFAQAGKEPLTLFASMQNDLAQKRITVSNIKEGKNPDVVFDFSDVKLKVKVTGIDTGKEIEISAKTDTAKSVPAESGGLKMEEGAKPVAIKVPVVRRVTESETPIITKPGEIVIVMHEPESDRTVEKKIRVPEALPDAEISIEIDWSSLTSTGLNLADRNVRVLGTLVSSGSIRVNIIGYPGQVLPAGQTETIVPVFGAPMERALDVSLFDSKKLQIIAHTVTKSQDMVIDYNSNIAIAKTPNFIVRVNNYPSLITGIFMRAVASRGTWAWSKESIQLEKSELSYFGGVDQSAYSRLYGQGTGLVKGDDVTIVFFDEKSNV